MYIVSYSKIQFSLVGVLILVVAISAQCSAQTKQESPGPDQEDLESAARKLLETTSTPRIENGWYESPPWAMGLPFVLQSNFDIKPEENRERPYLEALLEFESDCYWLFPHLRDADEAVLKQFLKAPREREDKLYSFLLDDDIYEENGDTISLEPAVVARAKELMELFHIGFLKLEQAQQRPKCFFHSEWTPSSLNLHVIASGQAIRLLAIKCQVELGDSKSVKYVEMGLRLKRDLVPLGQMVGQFVGHRIEKTVFHEMVLPMLEHEELADDQLARLILVLKEHDIESRASDIFLEATKRELLDLRHVLHLLENQNYATPGREEHLSMDPESLPVTVLLRELVDYEGYGINSQSVVRKIEEFASVNKEAADAWQKFKAETGNANFEDGARILMGMFAHFDLESLRPGDLKDDVAVLNLRYRQAAAARHLPFPESTHRLKQLEDNWTTDDSWKNSRILRWFTPRDGVASVRESSRLRINVFLCLAAVRKWQLEHDGKNPNELFETISAIGFDQVPIDPYSGKPIQMLVSDSEVVVFSAGPDGDDDQAKVEFDPYRAPDLNSDEANDGDIIFRLMRR